MQIVIDMPEEMYQYVMEHRIFPDKYCDKMRIVIENGSPLPKGHGRLIDEEEIKSIVDRIASMPWGDADGNRVNFKFTPKEVKKVIEKSPTIVERSE